MMTHRNHRISATMAIALTLVFPGCGDGGTGDPPAGDARSPDAATDASTDAPVDAPAPADAPANDPPDARSGDAGPMDAAVPVARAWRGPVQVSLGAGHDNAGPPQVGTDEYGNAVVVWKQWRDGKVRNWQSRYVAASDAWTTPSPLSGEFYQSSDPSVSVNPAGDAMAVWIQDQPGQQRVMSRFFRAAAGSWLGAQPIGDVLPYSGFRPHVAMDPAGNAVAVWDRSDGSATSVWASRFDVMSLSWSAPQVLESSSDPAQRATVAIDADGDAMAVWDSRDQSGGFKGIHHTRLDALTGTWSPAAVLDPTGGSANYGPQLSMTPDGSAVIVWFAHGQTSGILKTARYDALSDTWSVTAELEQSAEYPDHPAVATDAAGNAIAVWHRELGDDIWSRRYDVATDSWGPVTPIGAPGAGEGYRPYVGMDQAGNAIAVFTQDDDGTQRRVYANRYDAATGTWGTAERIDGAPDGAYDVRVSVTPWGDAMAVWRERVGDVYTDWANRYGPI